MVVGDAPLQSCDIDLLWKSQDWFTIPRFYESHSKLKVVLDDWRLELYHRDGKLTFRKELRQSDDRFLVVDLGKDSMLEPVAHDYENFRVTNYDPAALQQHHRPGRHEYCVSRRILEADIILNVAKLKSHRKAGMTGCLKNFVGINGHKSFLPHHRRGPASQGHDEYPRANVLKSVRTINRGVAGRGLKPHAARCFFRSFTRFRIWCWHSATESRKGPGLAMILSGEPYWI